MARSSSVVKQAREARMGRYKREPKPQSQADYSGFQRLLRLYNANRYSSLHGRSIFSFIEWLFPSRRKPPR